MIVCHGRRNRRERGSWPLAGNHHTQTVATNPYTAREYLLPNTRSRQSKSASFKSDYITETKHLRPKEQKPTAGAI